MIKQFPIDKEYVKNPEIKPEDVRKLREWLKTQPHLPGEKITDLDLILMYHSCERSAEVTKQVLDLHYSFRSQAALFQELRFDEKTEQLARGNSYNKTSLHAKISADPGQRVSTMLPEPTAEGYRVIFGRLVDTDPKNYNFVMIARNLTMQLDLWQYETGSWPGLVLVLDMHGISLAHLARVDVSMMQQFLYYLQEALPARLREAHFLNAPPFMDTILGLLKRFLSSAILDIIRVHRDTKVEGIVLPKEEDYGKITASEISYMKANARILAEVAAKTVDQAKRPAGQDSRASVGSFKMLDID